MEYRLFRYSEREDLDDQQGPLSRESWPEFLRHGDTDHWGHLFETFSEYQILICDRDDRVVAMGHAVPLVWDGRPEDLPASIDDIIVRALRCRQERQTPNAFSALAVMVAGAFRRRGLSAIVLQAMREQAARHGCGSLIVPVRPILKSRFPLIPMERYARWAREDGSPYDPWIRVHWRAGAEPLTVAHKTVTVTGTIADWERWTGLEFPGTGEYVVPGALQPVFIDREGDQGIYEDPVVWMRHRVD